MGVRQAGGLRDTGEELIDSIAPPVFGLRSAGRPTCARLPFLADGAAGAGPLTAPSSSAPASHCAGGVPRPSGRDRSQPLVSTRRPGARLPNPRATGAADISTADFDFAV